MLNFQNKDVDIVTTYTCFQKTALKDFGDKSLKHINTQQLI